MREQVITPRAGATSAGSGRSVSAGKGRSGDFVQNPARRKRDNKTAARGESGGGLTAVLSYAPLAGKILIAVVAGLLLFAGYRAAASASFFQVRTINVGGTSRASEDEIKTIVRRAASRTGVWRADLNGISAEIEKSSWVRSAIVSRVLPDGLRVRITERTPLAIARTGAGRLVWVDDDAVTLGAMLPTDKMPAFFIVGLDEGNGDAARVANRERMQKYLEMAREWDAQHLSDRISEVNLTDVRDVRAQLAGDDAEIEVRLGAKDFGKRLKTALGVLDEQRNTPRGASVTHLDATLDRRVIVGFSSGAPQTSSETQSDTPATAHTKRREHDALPKKPSSQQKETKREAAPRKTSEAEQRKKRAEKRAAVAIGNEKAETRPRRVK